MSSYILGIVRHIKQKIFTWMRLLDVLLRGTVVASGRGSETALSTLIHENPWKLTSINQCDRDRELLRCAAAFYLLCVYASRCHLVSVDIYPEGAIYRDQWYQWYQNERIGVPGGLGLREVSHTQIFINVARRSSSSWSKCSSFLN